MAPTNFTLTPGTHTWYFLVITYEALKNLWLVFQTPCFETAVKLEAVIQMVLVLGSLMCTVVFGVTDNIVFNTSQSTESFVYIP
jgi:hypothetical protein